MRVLWLCNIVLPELCEEIGLRKTNIGGWITGMWQELKKKKRDRTWHLYSRHR